MAIFAGIDEAGYGPLLGPLVVGMAAFRAPVDEATPDLWKLFQIGRAKDKKRTAAGVRVGDSKELYKGANALATLEENLLPFLQQPGEKFPPFMGHLKRVCNEPPTGLSKLPWYKGRDLKLPRKANPQRIIDRAAQLQRALEQASSCLVDAAIEVMTVPHYNSDIAETNNKSTTSATRAAALMTRLWNKHGLEGIRLVVDKQGGRDKYAQYLGAVFPEATVTVFGESAELSSYRITEGPGWMDVTFRPKADQTSLPTALASMLCKHTREVFMELFCDWWSERVPGLKPTAGYVTDGLRFLKDIDAAIKSEKVDVESMVRCR
jgi:ribonuclease HII